jgi:hypothetical protein
MKKRISIYLILGGIVFWGCSGSKEIREDEGGRRNATVWFDPDTVKAGEFDTGTMWTFEYFPKEYFQNTYGFDPDEAWINNARLAALRFADYCSASFISDSGLIMTNDHCARESVVEVTLEGEDILKNGFYASTREEERRVKGLFVDQLVLIRDVTEEVHKGLNEGKSENEVTEEIIKREEDTTLIFAITPLYFGGRYSLYGYKRYDDIRLVFTPEGQLGHFGGEYDNFTYPRYSFDCAFFRAYDNEGNALITNNRFRWSDGNLLAGEPVFVIGNPGTTNRLNSVAQLEIYRDVIYPNSLAMYQSLLSMYENAIKSEEHDNKELEVQVMQFQNAIKAFTGMLSGLRDPILMQRKRDFEEKVKAEVNSRGDLRDEYGDVWEKLEKLNEEKRRVTKNNSLITGVQNQGSEYFSTAFNLVELSYQLSLPEAERDEYFKKDEIDETIELILPKGSNPEEEKEILTETIEYLIKSGEGDNKNVRILTEGKNTEEAVNNLIKRSILNSKEKVSELIEKGSVAIKHSNDPFIQFAFNINEEQQYYQERNQEITAEENRETMRLGRAIYEVYGTRIPPDATFTLRISDGVVRSFPYNGTIAPPITTFYGMYDRYYSFNKEYPWDLPESWQSKPEGFDLSTPYNFISTNDIVGGNSGSPVINRNGEVVGLAFDGNIQGLPGNFIFRTEENRMVSVHSKGIIEALRFVYKADRIINEIEGEVVEKKTNIK